MKKMMNSLAGYATALVMIIFAMTSVMFFNSCETGIDDTVVKTEPCPDCPDTNPDPEKEVKEVKHYGCELLSFDWSYKNAAGTRSSEYSVELADGGTFCNSPFKYLADIVYTDGSSQKADEEYNNRSSFVGFGYKNTLYVAAGEAATFENAPEITKQNTSNGVVTFLEWEKKTVAVLANTVNDVKSLTIGGKTMTDLCLPEVEFEYVNSKLEKIGEDDKFIDYTLTVYGDATVDYDGKSQTNTFHFVLPIKEAKSGSVNPPVEDDKEVVDYNIVNEKLDDNGNYSGDLEELLSDGSTTIVGTISFSFSFGFDAEGNKTVKVNELSYTKKSAAYGKNIRTGENRSFSQLGCVINLIGMKNTVSMVTNRGSRMFSGFWEYPTITLPNGKEVELLHNVAEMTEGSISDNGISGDQLVINLTTTGKYGSKVQDLTSTITLVKVDDGEMGGGDEDDFQTGSYAKDQRVEGSVIKWTLVRTFNKKADTETAMSVAHKYAMSLDSRKSTENRVYNAGTPALNETSRVMSTDGNYSFDFCSYASTWNYLDFSHAAKAEGRRNIVYHDGDFDVPVWDAALSIERNGVTLGTSNISSSSDKETYLDLINYALFAGDASVSAKSQEVEYSKKLEQSTDEDAVYYNVEKIGVKGDKLYYNEIERHTINTELNKTVEKSISLKYNLTATAVADWTTTASAAGIYLTTYSQNYTTAKDYIFGSNRGNNIAKTSLQTSYTVTYMGKEYTLTITGAVQGSVNLVSSTSNKNTYSFTATLLADGKEIASDSDTCIETIEEEEIPDQDVVTYNVEKIGVRGDKLYYYEVEKHSIHTDQNKTVEKSVQIIASVEATAVADWTTTASAAGIMLSTYAQNYTTAKDYIFGSNRGNNIAKASLQTSYTVTYMGKEYTLTITGAVQASVNLMSSTSNKNTYSFNAVVLADGKEVAKDSDTCIETIEEEEIPDQDVVTYNVEKVGVSGDKLYYNEVETHSLYTEKNKSVKKSVDLVYSLSATAVADWTAKASATGIMLSTYAQNYTIAKDYIFGSNRGNNIAKTSLQTSYTVTYMGKEYTLTVTGAVQASVNLVSSTSSKNTYSFNATLLADGQEIASDSDNCVETIEEEETPVEDVVTYNVKKTGVRGNKLYYNEIETHSVNTNENKTVEKSVNLVYSLSATAVADWTAKEGATGIRLTTASQNYTTAKDYIFGSNRGNNTAKASLQTSYTVTYMGKSYTLTVTGAVQASVNLVSSTSNKNTYSFTATLLADGKEIASDSDTCIETIEQEETPDKDVVTYDVEKIGVRGNKLYYNEIEKHSINTGENKTVEKNVNLVYSLNATAVADWTAEEGATGITLTNSQFNYNGAKDYVFNSNRGSNKATASLQTTYVVSYGGKNHNLTINGTVSGAISRTSSTSSSNTYSFTARLFADGVEIANDSDSCVETIKASEPDEPTQNIGAVAYYSAVTFTATGTPYVTFATVYNNGKCIVKKAGNVEVARGENPGGTVTEMGGVPVKIVDNNTVYYYYRADGSAIGAVPMSEITIKGYPSGILSVKETVNADGTVTLSNEYGSATFGAY